MTASLLQKKGYRAKKRHNGIMFGRKKSNPKRKGIGIARFISLISLLQNNELCVTPT